MKNINSTVDSIKHSTKSVFFDIKQYLSFFVALLIIQTIFWTLLITTGVNNKMTHEQLVSDYQYHILITGISSETLTNLRNQDALYKNISELWPELVILDSSSDGFTRTENAALILNESQPLKSYNYFLSVNNSKPTGIKSQNIEETPLFTDDPSVNSGNRLTYILCFSGFLVLTLLFGLSTYMFAKPKRDTGEGERIYRSTTKENLFLVSKRISFSLMILTGGISLIFLLLALCHGNGATYLFAYLLLLLVCILFMTELFNVRVNHYKFRYGIYMTFGAGFRKLYLTAIREMLLVSAATLLPALGLSMLSSLLIYAPTGTRLFFPWEAIPGVIILNIIIILSSTYLPMKAMAIKPPVTLLYAQDNSNLVVSPRRSFKMYGKKFPSAYEIYGMWRFRRYFIKLTAVAIAFSTVFLCGIYVADVVAGSNEGSGYEFELSNSDDTSCISDKSIADLNDELSDSSAFSYLFWSEDTPASSLKYHLMISKDNIKSNNNFYNIEGSSADTSRRAVLNAGYNMTTDSFKFVSYNKTLIDTIINNNIYNVEGDLNSVLENDRTIIISEYITNIAGLDIKPGDSVYLAVPIPGSVFDFDAELIRNGLREQALSDLIDISSFNYLEYTVGAVIDYGGADSCFIFGLNSRAYNQITGTDGITDNLKVFTTDAATTEDFSVLGKQLRDNASLYGYRVEETYGVVRSRLFESGGHIAIIMTVSLLIMLVSPLIWFFSQLQFYRRRNKEMFILRSLGAVEKHIRKIYLFAGLTLAVLSAVMTLVMSFLADYLIYLVCTFFADSLNTVGGVNVSFYMPPLALIMCLVLAVACGFLSSWLPFALRKVLISKSEIYAVDGH